MLAPRFEILLLLVVLTGLRVGLFRSCDSDAIQAANTFIAGNQVEVTTSRNLDPEAVEIRGSQGVVFRRGEFLGNIAEEYGGPHFAVFYNRQKVGSTFHYNTNDWYTNEFVFHFFRDAVGRVRFTVATKGKRAPESGYIWLTRQDGGLIFDSYDQNGRHVATWTRRGLSFERPSE